MSSETGLRKYNRVSDIVSGPVNYRIMNHN